MTTEDTQLPRSLDEVSEALTHALNKIRYLEEENSRILNSLPGKIYLAREKIRSSIENINATRRKAQKLIDKEGFESTARRAYHKLTRIQATPLHSQRDIEDTLPVAVDHPTPTVEQVGHGRRLSISWIVYGHLPKGGGHRNIYRMAHHLEKFGHRVTLYITDTRIGSIELTRSIRQELYPIQGEILAYEGNIKPTDVLIGTHWETITHVKKHALQTRAICYFVQDYEPLFYPMGSEYLLAQDTYKHGYQHICSGEWVFRKIQTNHQARGGFFQFPIDKDIYRNKALPRDPRKIIFFAKPEMNRRCFEIGVRALNELHGVEKSFEVVMFGSQELKNFKYEFPHQILSFVKTIDELADLYNSATLGMAFSTTNPSLVPYEMMASGLVVVDLYTEFSEFNYGNSYEVAALSEPNPTQLAQHLKRLLNDTKEIAARKAAGLSFTQGFPTEQQAARIVEKLILESMPN